MSPIELGLAGGVVVAIGLALWALLRTRRLETAMNTRLASIEHKLDALPTLATKQDILNANQATVNQLLLSLGLRSSAGTAVGSIITGGGAAAAGGMVSDQRATG